MEMEVTQVTFLSTGQTLVAGPVVGDATKVVIATAPVMVAVGMARALSEGLAVRAKPPEEDILEIREL